MQFLGGDFRFFWPQSIIEFARVPSSWDNTLNTGIGQVSLGSLWITSYLNFTSFFSKFGLSWDLISLFFWILPSFIISFISAYLLFNYFFPNRKRLAVISGTIYVLNSYFLLLILGGQTGVALSYSLLPLVLLAVAKCNEKLTINYSVIVGLVFSLNVLFDPRIFYISLIAVFLYSLIFVSKSNLVRSFIYTFCIPLIIVLILHNYWIIPLILSGSSPIPTGFDSPEGFKYLSFADFSHTLSFLHPNWPENIFGKTSFQKPEFLILPILAFGALLLSRKQELKKIAFLSLLGLLGAFLSKGVNEPFGGLNNFLFVNLPGMSMFRDPTKWYILISVSYSLLIPITVGEIDNLLKTRFKKAKVINVKLIFFIFYLLLFAPNLINSNIIKLRLIPNEYKTLSSLLSSDQKFYRTLWIPSIQRYGFFSDQHPAIGRGEIFKNSSLEDQLNEMGNIAQKERLEKWSIKYVIIPYDSDGVIFQEDRKYSQKINDYAIEKLEKIHWLKRVVGFEKLAVFETKEYKDHFYTIGDEAVVKNRFISPSKYKLEIKNAKQGDVLIFSEKYSPYWVAIGSSFSVASKIKDDMNSFVLPKSGDYSLEIQFSPQKMLEKGFIISFSFLFILLVFLVNHLVKNRKNAKIH